MMNVNLALSILVDTFAICRLGKDTAIPDWALTSPFVSITRTSDELSIVCPQSNVPDGIKCERGWRCLKVEGTLDFALTGILVSLATPLAQAGIGIFVLSTYDTDYLMVKEIHLQQAVLVLSQAGHRVR
jgi:hypothetical protein